MRLDPSDRSEMTNQILHGETMVLLQENEKWYRVKLDHDHYEGWVDKKQLDVCESTQIQRGHLLPNPMIVNTRFYPAGSYLREDVILPPSTTSDIMFIAKQFLGVPYLWGGRSHAGIDCSGFTQIVYRIMGYLIPRDANQQAALGSIVDFLEISTTGDLAFFENEEGKIIHVGIILNNCSEQYPTIIHASGEVRVDILDNQGIKKNNGEQTHKLRFIKRLML
jgi:uncharacterized protein YgiM (DUF1202 family)